MIKYKSQLAKSLNIKQLRSVFCVFEHPTKWIIALPVGVMVNNNEQRNT